jgi:hypothetical protein
MSGAGEWLRDVVVVPLVAGTVGGAYSGLIVTRYLEFQSAKRKAVSEMVGFELTFVEFVAAEPGEAEDVIASRILQEPISAFLFAGHIEAAARVLDLKHRTEGYLQNGANVSEGIDGARKFSGILGKEARDIPADWWLILFGVKAAAFVSRTRGRRKKIMDYIDGVADDWR